LTKQKKLRVLIADDERAIVRVYSIGLQRFFNAEKSKSTDVGVESSADSDAAERPVSIEFCQQGADAVKLARKAHEAGEPFDVVVLDIRMPPGMSGVEAGQKIREFDQSVPIIFVSSYTDQSLEELQTGVPPSSLASFVEKPVQLSRLASQIRSVAS
jgi:CheY-like chemotaxis protein